MDGDDLPGSQRAGEADEVEAETLQALDEGVHRPRRGEGAHRGDPGGDQEEQAGPNGVVKEGETDQRRVANVLSPPLAHASHQVGAH